MSKNKWTGFSAAALLIAGTAFAASQSTTQTVDASVTASIEISIDSATESLTLVPGTTSTADATLTVNSSNPYTITAAADTDATKSTNANELFEWDSTTTPAAYVSSGKKVGAVLQVAGAAGTATGTGASAADITTSGITIFTGSSATSGGTVTATLSQNTPWGTAALPTGHTYHMVVTYTASTTSV